MKEMTWWRSLEEARFFTVLERVFFLVVLSGNWQSFFGGHYFLGKHKDYLGLL